MKNLIVLFVCLAANIAFAQKGYLRGQITDGENGEPLLGATVAKNGTSIGTVADFDGNYSLELDAGLHTITVQFVSYQTITKEIVEIKSGKTTALDFSMNADIAQLAEVVVTAEIMKDSEAGILTFQRKSANVLDAVSSQTFKKTGDGNLAVAMKRVTGISVQRGQQGGGQYVYVRGLGDRYTRTTLNGMTIPGLDPDRNDVQIDIFPTAIIENVVVYKTSSPNLPGDFTGGIVDVETKNFPEEKNTSVSLKFGFNPSMHFNKDYLTYNVGDGDWLGFDDGTRKLPFPAETVIPPTQANDPRLEILTRSLNPNMGVKKKRSFMNTSFSFNHGNQINKSKYTLGYSAVFSYQNLQQYYENVEFGEYTKDDNPAVNGFFAEEVRTGALARSSVLWSGLLAGAIKFSNHTFSASVFRTQQGVSEASERINQNFDQTNATLYDNILTYSQRSVTNSILSGTHQLNKLRIDWKNSFTLARTYDPDYRSISISISNEDPTLNRGDGAGMSRFWRDLNEFNENFKVDFKLPYGKNNKLQFGGLVIYKDRDFEVLSYLVDVTQRSGVPLDPDYFLRPENIWTSTTGQGTFLQGNYEAPNNYSANSGLYTGYIMTDMVLFKGLKAIYGLRLEKANMFYTGINTSGVEFNDEKTLDEFNLLPSINLVYGLSETMNVRGSYGKTLARPSFKEKSAATIYDPISKRFFNGNLDLTQTMINNYDLRWENFFLGGDMISLSLFYKKFDGHIELVTYDVAPSNVRPRNSGKSNVYGLEFELRKKLAFISPSLTNLSIGTNVSLANSAVDLRSVIVNESGLTEFESRKNNARDGEAVKQTRHMAGQAPYLINAYLNYADAESLMNFNLSYNVQGESLFIVGVGAVPDIYTLPFHSLNFNAYRNLGPQKNHRISFLVDNILQTEKRDVYKGFGGAEETYSIFRPGTSFSVMYTYNFK